MVFRPRNRQLDLGFVDMGMGVRGQVQREGKVVHVVVNRLDDLSPLLATVGRRGDVARVYRTSPADVERNPVGPDPRDQAGRILGRSPRDIYIPDLCLGSSIVPGHPTKGIKINPATFGS